VFHHLIHVAIIIARPPEL